MNSTIEGIYCYTNTTSPFLGSSLQQQFTRQLSIMRNPIIICFLLIAGSLNAQKEGPEAKLEVHSIEAIVTQTFKLLTRDSGEAKDLQALRDLYLPNARFTILNQPVDSFNLPYESLTLDEFLAYMEEEKEYYEKGFIQFELGKVINEYNGIANVFQSFYAKDGEGDEAEGITSYQLLFIDDRWWISDLLWTINSNGVPIPDKYLGK